MRTTLLFLLCACLVFCSCEKDDSKYRINFNVDSSEWRMISLPFDLARNPFDSPLITYNNNAGYYVYSECIKSGQAYWIKLNGNTSAGFSRDPEPVSIFVRRGWNMIGSPTGEPIDLSIYSANIDCIFQVDNNYLQIDDYILLDGFGYWLKANEDFSINI